MNPPPSQPAEHVAPGKVIFVTRRCGRLANRLLLFAQFVALAEEQGHRVINFAFHTYAHLFESTCSDVFCRYPAATRKGLLDSLPGVAGAIRGTRIFYHAVRAASGLNEWLPVCGKKVVTLRELPGRDVTRLEGPEVQAQIRDAKIVLANGWKLRAPDWVRKHADKIRRYFKPVPELDRASSNAVERLRREAPVVVGVHIRQSDFRVWKGGRFFFPVSRYADWMREMAGQFPGDKVAFLICSDEPRSEQEFAGLTVGFGPNSPVGDLCALAKCDYIIGPHSTFSQWASFYGNTPIFHVRDSRDRLEREKFQVLYPDDMPLTNGAGS